MGNAVSTLNNSIDGIFQNPATLSQAPKFLHANYTNLVLDINTTSIGYGSKTKYFNYAVNLSYMNFGDFDKYDEDGNDEGTFSANDKELSLSIAKKLGNYLSFGITASYLNSSIDNYSAHATKMNIGLQYYHPKEKLSIGISYNNLDKMLSNYANIDEKIPNLLLIGISKKLQYLPAVVSFDILKYQNYDYIANLGIKFTPSDRFRIYLGTSSRKVELQNQTDIQSLIDGVSAGVGFSIHSYNFDMSYSSLGDAGGITSFSFYKILE